MQNFVGGQDGLRTEVPFSAFKICYATSGFSHHQRDPGKIPGSRTVVQKGITGSGSNVSDV